MITISVFLIYIKVALFLFVLLWSGIVIIRRVVYDYGAEIIIPTGMIFSVAFYIFLLNSISHILRGPIAFITALGIQIVSSFLLQKYYPAPALKFPAGRIFIVWIFTLVFWSIFLYLITAHAKSNGADVTIHYSLASVFARGDYPMHTPWQPDYIAYYHIGFAQLIGAVKTLTGAPYYFLQPLFAYLLLISVSQIIIWLALPKVKASFLHIPIIFIPALVAFISFGGFMLAWPTNFQLPNIGSSLLTWLKQLPSLNDAHEIYGSPANLDALIYFIHRLIGTAFLIGSLPILLHTKRKSNLFTIIITTIYLSAIALADETTFIVIILPILILAFFNIFQKKIFKWIAFSLGALLLISFQGGIITETILNRYGDKSNILIFPEDGSDKFTQYRSYRINQQKLILYPPKTDYYPFRWFHPGIILQLIALFLIFLLINKNSTYRPLLKNILLFLLSISFISFIAFHGLVPKGYSHPNGNRFLALSYYFSGLAIGIFVVNWWFTKNRNLIIKSVLIWILVFSIIPPLGYLFPRPKDFWFKIYPYSKTEIEKLIIKSIPLKERIIVLTDSSLSTAPNIELVRGVGAFTPIWLSKPRVHDGFDVSPMFSDIYYTLNPDSLGKINISHIVVSDRYLENLTELRKKDLNNPNYFNVRFISKDQKIKLLTVQPSYFQEGKILDGTYTQFLEKAPKDKSYYIDYPPNITENVYRILRFILNDRVIYYNPQGAFYNFRVDIDLIYYGDSAKSYDYLILGQNVDPAKVCNCQTELIWTGFKNGIKLWKTASSKVEI